MPKCHTCRRSSEVYEDVYTKGLVYALEGLGPKTTTRVMTRFVEGVKSQAALLDEGAEIISFTDESRRRRPVE